MFFKYLASSARETSEWQVLILNLSKSHGFLFCTSGDSDTKLFLANSLTCSFPEMVVQLNVRHAVICYSLQVLVQQASKFSNLNFISCKKLCAHHIMLMHGVKIGDIYDGDIGQKEQEI